MRKLIKVIFLFGAIFFISCQENNVLVNCKPLHRSSLLNKDFIKKFNLEKIEDSGIYSICQNKDKNITAIHFIANNKKNNKYYFMR